VSQASVAQRAAAPVPGVAAAPRRARAPLSVVLVGGVLLLCLSVVLSLLLGVRPLDPSAVARALGGGAVDADTAGIVSSRLDRTVIALVVGGCVALSGALLQGLTRNPVADPGILGLNSGAALAVVVGIRFWGLDSVGGYAVAALAGTVVVAVLVQGVALTAPRRSAPLAMVLSGAAVMALATSLIAGLVVTNRGALDAFRFWQVGSVAGRDGSQVLQVLPFLAVGLLLALTAGPTLNAVALGDDVARGLGQQVLLNRGLAATGAVLLAATATALAGPIGFVGLVVPHAARALVGADHRRVLLVSLVLGPSLVVLADVAGRLLARPSEVQAGIVCAVIGAPVLIAVVRRTRTL
jgi:iron complex transport system permease protein